MDAMVPLLQRKTPNQLDELKIINCQITGKVSGDLIDAIAEDNRLQSITLIHVNMTDEAFEVLSEVMATSRYLKKVDLSWCERQYNDFLPFYEMLAENRMLTTLNLSWNSLFDTTRGTPIYSEEDLAKQAEHEAAKKNKPKPEEGEESQN